MIKLPYGQPIYKRLLSRFTSFSELMSFLEEENFTGYLELDSWEGSGKIILKEGEVTHVIMRTVQGLVEGDPALKQIYRLVMQPDCFIDVYELPSSFTELVERFCHAELIYYHLDSRFTDLRKLLGKLHHQNHFGLVEVEFEKPKQLGIIYIKQGKIIKTQLVTETPKKTYSRDYPIRRLLDSASQKPALINVYRVSEKGEPQQSMAALRPKRATDSASPDGKKNGNFLKLKEVVSEIGELFSKLEILLGKLEKGLDFEYYVRRNQLELAEKYPFLDPFASEVEYKDGTLSLFVPPGRNERFLEGLRILVLMTLDTVTPFIPESVFNQTCKQHLSLMKTLGIDSVSN